MKKTDGKMLRSTTSKADHEVPAAANPEANRALLMNMREMMQEMRGDIIKSFNDTISDVVRREITGALAPLEKKITAFSSAIHDLELSATEQDGRLTSLQHVVSKQQEQLAALSKKCEDLEGRSRQNNIRILGVPEGEEGPRPTEFVAGFLQKLLQLNDKPILDRAHRTLQPRPVEGARPRAFIARVNMFQVRNDILRKASAQSPLHYNGKRVFIFPDFTAAVAKKRASFSGVKKELHACPGIKFGLLFPATLRITLPGGSTHKFDDPDAALDFVKNNVKIGVVPDSV